MGVPVNDCEGNKTHRQVLNRVWLFNRDGPLQSPPRERMEIDKDEQMEHNAI
jgi:hypothetical protein